jgi:ribonucleoside-diphosphate reductase alpha subunit
VFLKVASGIANNMSTKQLDDLISETAGAMIIKHPDYSQLAGNIGISRLHKEVPEDILKVTKKLFELGVVTEEYLNKIKEYHQVINDNIVHERDYLFDYFGYGKLKSTYLLKDKKKNNLERPQHMYVRVALCVTDTVEDFIELYNSLSLHEISSATPTTLNAGTVDAQYASCNLSVLGDDSKDALLDLFNRVCTASSKAEGIGIALHNIRSKESNVGKEDGKAGGLLKYMKIINEGLRFFNQRGKRPGSCAIYLEPWHKDIEDLLDARDLFTALWIPDNFMKAVKEGLDWYLFCPDEIKKAGLKAFHEIHGAEYEAEYEKAVELGIGTKVVAKELWYKILESQIETGMPYMCYKDNINSKSNQENIGTVKSSNLCAEIVEVTGTDPEDNEEYTAICTLSSLVLKNYITDGKFDFQKLYDKVKIVAKYLNKVIDINTYSTKEGRKGGLDQRAMGIGVQGLADTFAILNLPFTSPEARDLNKKIAETIYFAAVTQSMETARATGQTYKYFEGSPMSKGIFQFDMWGIPESDLMWDWKSLRKLVIKYGVVNSLFTAGMPTASSAILTGANECFEPFNYNMYNRKVLGGDYTVSNKYLVKDLENEGLWTDEVISEIIKNDSSIQDIPVIEDWIKEKYKTVWEISQKELIEMAADRGPFIDQSQSMNIFMKTPSVSKLTSSHFFAHSKGLKTGMYYLRSEPIEMKGKHLGMDLTVKTDPTKSSEGDYECVGCSA